ncbi:MULTISPECIES: hypothetical protein [unclassified Sphingobium]|uniref:hypothetical protein n=1 Tax=unclassified Sphingobium TaxID=2611147 RepID=UPI001E394BA1|nr:MULTISPECIES: hypothetical protein [unclassified Sphingobium]
MSLSALFSVIVAALLASLLPGSGQKNTVQDCAKASPSKDRDHGTKAGLDEGERHFILM